MANKQQHVIRIIGGRWRSRRLPVTLADGLRPTSDRIRETVFNWLAPMIEGARCLDLYAGTGALGLEALSRGASSVTFIESNRQAVHALRQSIATLEAKNSDVINDCAENILPRLSWNFDVVFIDPPFKNGAYANILADLPRVLNAYARVYVEYNAQALATINATIQPNWQLLRQKKAGQVGYSLLTLQ